MLKRRIKMRWQSLPECEGQPTEWLAYGDIPIKATNCRLSRVVETAFEDSEIVHQVITYKDGSVLELQAGMPIEDTKRRGVGSKPCSLG